MPEATLATGGEKFLTQGLGPSDLGAGYDVPAETLSLLTEGPAFKEALGFFLEVSALAEVLASAFSHSNCSIHKRRAACSPGGASLKWLRTKSVRSFHWPSDISKFKLMYLKEKFALHSVLRRTVSSNR